MFDLSHYTDRAGIHTRSCVFQVGRNTVLVNGAIYLACIPRPAAFVMAKAAKRDHPEARVEVFNIASNKSVEVANV